MPELSDIDLFSRLTTIINLELIRYITNPISKVEKLGALIISKAYGSKRDNTVGFIDMGDTTTETSHFEPQASDIAGTSSNLTPPLTVVLQLSTSKSISVSYVLVS